MQKTLMLLASIAATTATPILAATPIAGRWITEEKTAIVTVGPCGAAICGRLTTLLKQPPSGPPVDSNNPDPKLRQRPLEGLVILSGFTDKGDDWRGRIYDPRSGKTYKSILKRDADGTLKVQGCIAFFCRTQRWSPVRG